jgi:hypothetical protein
MAPEQALAEEVGTWTDIYAVGLMAFEFFVGHPPFQDTPAPLVLMMRHVQDPVPSVLSIDPTIDPRIAQWIDWLTSKEPSNRPQSAAAAWETFEEILIGSLGPRWRQGAPLLAFGAGTTHAPPGPATPMPAGAPRGPLTVAALATTLEPEPAILDFKRTEPAPPAAPRRGGAGMTRRKAALVAVAFLAAAGAAFAAVRQGGHTSPTTASKLTITQPAAAAAPTSASAAATGAPAAPAGENALSTQAKEARGLAQQFNKGAARIESLGTSGPRAGSNALVANLMRKTARAYSAASRAAAKGDMQGYATHLAAALAAKAEVDMAVKAKAAPAAAGNQSATAPPPSACAGDSASDDPSDDSCGGP